MSELRNVSVNFTEEVAESPSNINAIVEILNNVADTTSELVFTINETPMEVNELILDVFTHSQNIL